MINSKITGEELCACGCGQIVSNKTNSYVNGHNSRVHNPFKGKCHSILSRSKMSTSLKDRDVWNKGLTKDDERVKNNIEKSAATFREKYRKGEINLIGRNKGRVRPVEEKLRISETLRKNPFVKHHLYLEENGGSCFTLTRSLHALIHQDAYKYLIETFGKEELDKFWSWFKARYSLDECTICSKVFKVDKEHICETGGIL